ncbi:1-phosphofructokinase family hexose kinase [Sphingobium nicotianae]|uniref:Phosphofructokinase n=1 Tax=Sphingobium nicotianae TaxID=2782607 RepID=A0A9X1DED3_9SPHN|nr:1-phosphofructokinase family hexose kinase [Sphingobium nicotianae]MBT2188359.1 1-phosphofructokinase family hexose kinase [Sphingobium nicotianae]
MKTIATLTMNPAIDVAYEADRVFHTHKIRARQERYVPGGGGINVSRVIARLGGCARAHYMAGGATGETFDRLLDIHQMVRSRIPIAGNTRISTAVFERESGKEYRFVPTGPSVSQPEWEACLAHLAEIECDILVASGSLPPGVPDDFYSRVRRLVAPRGTGFVLDSSGAALRCAAADGGILLLKPSLGELQHLVGEPLEALDDIAAAASHIVRRGQATYVAVTMGHQGALLAQASGYLHLPAVPVTAMSTVGAGDSFLAAMTFALACERDPVDAFRYGMAAGAAAVLSPGTDLCRLEDVERMFQLVPQGEQCPCPPSVGIPHVDVVGDGS